MSRKALVTVALTAILALSPFAFSDTPMLNRDSLKSFANEINSAWPGPVNIYLAGGNFSFREPSFANARIVGCAQVAGAMYYVIEVAGRPSIFIPQSQVLVIANLTAPR